MPTYDWSAVTTRYNRNPPNYTRGDPMAINVSGTVAKRVWWWPWPSQLAVTVQSVTDSSGRTWTANGQSATAVA